MPRKPANVREENKPSNLASVRPLQCVCHFCHLLLKINEEKTAKFVKGVSHMSRGGFDWRSNGTWSISHADGHISTGTWS